MLPAPVLPSNGRNSAKLFPVLLAPAGRVVVMLGSPATPPVEPGTVAIWMYDTPPTALGVPSLIR